MKKAVKNVEFFTVFLSIVYKIGKCNLMILLIVKNVKIPMYVKEQTTEALSSVMISFCRCMPHLLI